MTCPNCQETLLLSERQGVEIDYCPSCRGVWLDRGELDKLIERSASQPTTAAPAYRAGHDHGHGTKHHKKKQKSMWHELFDFD
jgi:Zn-finger nucleic acid-binding protein